MSVSSKPSIMMSKPYTAKNSAESLVFLFRLIEANDWDKLYNMFLRKSEDSEAFQFLAKLVAKSSSFNNMTMLHAVARFDPPSVIVKRIVDLCPDAPATTDVLNRTPLHVAAGTGAGRVVIKALVDAYPEACMIQDTDGRTPLHMVCDTSTVLFEENKNILALIREAPAYHSVGVLLHASLDSAIVEDKEGMSAIEYALCSDADLKTIQLIQRAAQKVRLREHDAVRKASAERRRVSIESEKTSGSSDNEGVAETARHFSATRGRRSVVRSAHAA